MANSVSNASAVSPELRCQRQRDRAASTGAVAAG